MKLFEENISGEIKKNILLLLFLFLQRVYDVSFTRHHLFFFVFSTKQLFFQAIQLRSHCSYLITQANAFFVNAAKFDRRNNEIIRFSRSHASNIFFRRISHHALSIWGGATFTGTHRNNSMTRSRQEIVLAFCWNTIVHLSRRHDK